MAAMIFNFYLFDRKGTCLHFQEWKRLSQQASSFEEVRQRFRALLLLLAASKATPSPHRFVPFLAIVNTSRTPRSCMECSSPSGRL